MIDAWTPFHAVAHAGLSIVYELIMDCVSTSETLEYIEFGSVHSRDYRERTPLVVASDRGHSVVGLLIENGAVGVYDIGTIKHFAASAETDIKCLDL
jgi:hypothetical protein